MDRFYILNNVEFEWDEEKDALNLRKHGVKFEEEAERPATNKEEKDCANRDQ